MPKDNGKVFERELLASFKRSGFRAHRISDKMFWSGNRPMSSESEADFWVFGAAESLSAAPSKKQSQILRYLLLGEMHCIKLFVSNTILFISSEVYGHQFFSVHQVFLGLKLPNPISHSSGHLTSEKNIWSTLL